MAAPTLIGTHIFVRDMGASMAFYRLLGFEPDETEHFSRITTPGGSIEFGSYALTRGYDASFREPSGIVPACALQFSLESPEDVDATHARLVAAGYHSALPPFDAFWGSRYAEIDDPDGNIVGIHGPRNGPRTEPPLG